MSPSVSPAPSSASRQGADFWRERAFFWLLLALIPFVVILLGYYLGEINQEEQIPMVLRALDPSYLKADWIVNSNQGFNHRWFYTQLMALLSRGLSVPGAFYLVFLLTLVGWATGVRALFPLLWQQGEETEGRFNSNALGTATALVTALIFFTSWGVISNHVFDSYLVPASIVCPLSLWVAVYLRRGEWKIAAALMLAAGLMHAQIGPFSGFFLLVAQFYALSVPNEKLADARRALLRHWPFWVACIGIPLLLAVLSTDPRALSAAQKREAAEILAYVRHPWHYLPLTWSKSDWVSLLSWLCLVAVARSATRPSRFLDGVLGVTLLFCATGFLPFLIDPLFRLVELQHFRMTIWLQMAGLFYVGRFVADLMFQKGKLCRVAGVIFAISLLVQIQHWPTYQFSLLLPLSAALFVYLEKKTREGAMQPRWIALLPLILWSPFWLVIHHARSELRNGLIGGVVALLILGIAALASSRKTSPHLALRLAQGVTTVGRFCW